MFLAILKRIIVSFSFFFIIIPVFSQDPLEISREMFNAVKSIKSMMYTFDAKERINGKFHEEKLTFKINVNPLKVYVFQHTPKEGMQLLYVTGKNDGKVKVNPGTFPWVVINLQPEGDLMLDNRHHSIYDAGYLYTTSILEYLLQKYPSQQNTLVTLNETVKMHGAECYHLTFTNPNYRLTLYHAQNNETPLSIAKKLHVNYYSILENNNGLKANNTVKAGTRLIVPNDYASKMELYVNKANMTPVYLKIFDTKGVFEEFTFSNVLLNPPFKEIDFSDKNPSYKF